MINYLAELVTQRPLAELIQNDSAQTMTQNATN